MNYLKIYITISRINMTENTNKPKLLVVDDTPANLHLLENILNQENYAVRALPNGKLALRAAFDKPPDLILLDIKMPHMDGYEVCARLKADERTHEVPVLFISALQEENDKVRAFEIGGVDYISKPFQPAEVLARVRTHLQIHALQQTLLTAKQQAEAANYAKSAFITNMSHELRTPLNAILGFAQITLQSAKLPEELQPQIEKIYRSGEYLLTLINDILDLSKVETGHIELFPQEISVWHFFEEIVDMFRFHAEQKGIGFHYHPDTSLPHTLQADPKRLRQIVLNLLGNAVKFTEQGHVTLNAAYQGGCLQLGVEDTGIGIAAEHLQEIFRPFAQTGKDRYKTQGTGLGLSITRKIAEIMGGEISVSSELGTGSCFQIRIPLNAGFDRPATEPKSTDGALQEVIGYRRRDGLNLPLRILIVDDITDNREMLCCILQPLGFITQEVSSGEACLQQARQFQPDAVLMDMRMPDIDGLETMRRLHALPGLEKLPVLIVSASVFYEKHETVLQRDGVTYLSKPVRRRSLLQALRKHLPLEWEYTASTTAQSAASQETLVFPAEWLAELEQAVFLGATQHIRTLLAERRKQGEIVPDNLQAWVEAYQYRQVLEWIAQQQKKVKPS